MGPEEWAEPKPGAAAIIRILSTTAASVGAGPAAGVVAAPERGLDVKAARRAATALKGNGRVVVASSSLAAVADASA
jgi:hypothetical protein